MARSPYAWGIDIGKCGLKALRCRVSPTEPRKLVADAFDFIEYPMMLSQSDADPVELVRAALEEFTSRNKLEGDRVAVAAPGQAGLAKFIKLPPLEAKKIPDIVRYEANQQIPFPLDQVVWDWQRLAGGIEEGGFLMDAEVALFAMKREQVAKALAPLVNAGIEVDVLQLQPIALANMAMFDQLPDPATIDPEKPPASLVLVSMGVDSTDLVVTNGLKIWQRSMPIGGSSFTKALVKEMKYTFTKAEQEKRNAVRAADPRAVFKAMRPVFSEFASELQRSLNYFTGTDRSATIGKVLLLGNAAKLRGLSDFVAKQLQLDVQRLDKYANLEGPAVLAAPAFRENRGSFGTAYGLALQAAGAGSLRTNLVPQEMLRDRIIAAKRPWAVAALLGLLTAAVVSFAGVFLAWQTLQPAKYTGAFSAADAAKSLSDKVIAAVEDERRKKDEAAAWQQHLVRVQDRRFQTLDMVRAVESLLPQANVEATNPADREELHIDSFDMQYFPDLATWFAAVKPEWDETLAAAKPRAAAAPPAADPAATAEPAPAEGDPAAAPQPVGPKGPGWVVQLKGHHFHNHRQGNEGEEFVRTTLIKNLLGEGPEVLVTAGKLAGQKVPVADLGIAFPVIVMSTPIAKSRERISSAAAPAAGSGEPADANAGTLELDRYDFAVQFAWQPTVPGAPPPPPPPAPEAAAF